MKYVLYKSDGTVKVFQREKKLEYEELSKLVGGMIEFSENYEGRNEHETLLLN